MATPTASALTHARRRLGPAPLRALFALVCGPAPSTATAGVRIGGLLVCAIDGTTLSVADTPANHGVYTTQPGHHGGSGYPLLRLVALVACGTRSPDRGGVRPHQQRRDRPMTMKLAEHLHAGMLVLCDRNLTTPHPDRPHRRHRRPKLLERRCKTNRKLPMLAASTTDPGCRCSAGSQSASSTPRSPSPPVPAGPAAATGWPPP